MKNTIQQGESSSQTTDLVNAGLMLVSLVLALQMPFSIFLLAYAVLGPLHYLTEISWLHEKGYFIQEKKDYRWLLLFSLLIALLSVLMEIPSFKTHPWVALYLNSTISTTFFCGLVSSLGFVFLKKWQHKLGVLLFAVVAGVLLHGQFYYLIFFGILLSTIVHVSVFTFLFIMQGAIRSKSRAAWLSLLVYLLCVFAIASLPIYERNYKLSNYLFNSYLQSNFQFLNLALANLLSGTAMDAQYVLLSEKSIRIQAFIAFAYIYHYLNWFSKVNIIKWNKVPARTRKITLVCWLLSMLIYAWDYKAGFLALLALSLAHVFLEFPLNIHSIQYLLKKLFSLWPGKKSGTL